MIIYLWWKWDERSGVPHRLLRLPTCVGSARWNHLASGRAHKLLHAVESDSPHLDSRVWKPNRNLNFQQDSVHSWGAAAHCLVGRGFIRKLLGVIESSLQTLAKCHLRGSDFETMAWLEQNSVNHFPIGQLAPISILFLLNYFLGFHWKAHQMFYSKVVAMKKFRRQVASKSFEVGRLLPIACRGEKQRIGSGFAVCFWETRAIVSLKLWLDLHSTPTKSCQPQRCFP